MIQRNSFFIFINLLWVLCLKGCAPALSPEEATRAKEMGIEKAKNGEYREAVLLLEKVSRFDVKDIQVYNYLAQSYEGLEEYAKAIEIWQKLLFVADPNSPEAKEAHERFLKAKAKVKSE